MNTMYRRFAFLLSALTLATLAPVPSSAQTPARLEPNAAETASPSAEFYSSYRRDAVPIARQAASVSAAGATQILLEDHVAIVRPDGSVSLYVHTARRLHTAIAATEPPDVILPPGAQQLTARIIHSDGTSTAITGAGRLAANVAPSLSSGDAIDEEYVLNYAGDGGIPAHPEAFQFVFGSFNEQVLHARFVVLMPAARADHGVVIATGEPPPATATVHNGMLERMWEQDAAPHSEMDNAASSLAIVRVVQDENGWSVPSSAEHQRRIETIHPGPRPEES
jgi:hypothetical protein